MKRWVIIFVLILPFLFAACGGGGGGDIVYTYYNTDTPQMIPDEGFASSDIMVTGAPTYVSKVTVTVAILHTQVADLDLILTAPDGITWIYLYNGESSGQDFWYTTFDDDAFIGIDSSVDPRTGSYMPTDSLYFWFYGEQANGWWTLDVVDQLPADDGYLIEWIIDIQ